jgi:effector-binding domain-containing protein
VESEPFKHIKTKLEFDGGGPSFATFTLDAVEGGTRIVWALDTEVGMNPVGRYMGLMMDGWVGKDYERGLEKLKALVESASDAATREALADPGTGALPPDIYTPVAADPSKGPEVVTIEARPVIRTQGSAPAAEDAAISGALGVAFQKILTFAEANSLEVGGAAPTAVTISHENGVWTFEAAMPLLAKPASVTTEEEGVEIGQSYAGKAVKVTHKGPYSTLKNAYERLHAYTKENKLKEKGLAWEEYVGDPAETGDDALLTNVYIAIE